MNKSITLEQRDFIRAILEHYKEECVKWQAKNDELEEHLPPRHKYALPSPPNLEKILRDLAQ